MPPRSPHRPFDASILSDTLRTMHAERPGLLCKGVPQTFRGTFGDIAAAGFHLGDARLPMPVALLSESAMAINRAWMTSYLRAAGVDLAPHGKTSLAPELFRMQMEDGAWGLTAATAQQVAFYASLGIRRVLLANQLVGSGNIAIVMDALAAHPDLELYGIVDSAANVEALSRAIAERPGLPPLRLLLEIGMPGGRTGVRDPKAAVALARQIHATPEVQFVGIEGYEGIAPGATQADREAAVTALIDAIRHVAEVCDAERLWEADEILLTAGGTEFFDLCSRGLSPFAGRSHRIVIRSGCYITHDSLAYTRAFERLCERSPEAARLATPRPRPALEVWAAVQSRPEPELAFATLGKRDISYDWDLPVPVKWLRPGAMERPESLPAGHRVLRLNDQHAYLDVPPTSPLAVGDLVGFGVSHVCTTFDKWRCLLTVDDAYRVTGAIRTFF